MHILFPAGNPLLFGKIQYTEDIGILLPSTPPQCEAALSKDSIL